MPHIDRLLASDEHVHLVSREHEVVLVGPFLRACIVLTACAYTAVRVAAHRSASAPARPRRRHPRRDRRAHARAAGARRRPAGSGGCSSSPTAGRILVHGGISRRIAALPLDAIHDLEIVRARPGWVLHYGGLIVSTGGRRDLMFGLRRLPDPDLLFGLLLGLADDLPEPSSPPRWRLTPGGVPVAAG